MAITASPPTVRELHRAPRTVAMSMGFSRYRLSEVNFNRFAILCGPIGQLLFFLFLPASLLLPPVSPSMTASETRDHYLRNETGMKGGISLMVLAGMFWPIFAAGINRQLARIPNVNPTILWAQLGAGSIAGISLMLPSMFFAATIYRLERDPALTQLLSDTAWFVFAMGFPPFIAQDLMITYAILSDNSAEPLFPHWMAWVNTCLTFTYYPALGVHCVKKGAIAWNGALSFWLGAVGFALQIGVLVFFMMKAVAKPDAEEEYGTSVESDESGSA
ncbi:hypothetical protein MMC30_008871 [Trapelia coarctata]|nr:hypothetical protein [Trapelia coarctata]